MFRLIGIVVLCLLVLGGLGLYFKWFGFSASNEGNRPDLHLTVDKTKVKEDLNVVKEKYHSLLGEKTVEGAMHHIETASQELTILDGQNKDVTIKVDAATKIKIGDKDGAFSDLKDGERAHVTYDVKKDGNSAQTITVPKAAE
jgi:hypothetical protein